MDQAIIALLGVIITLMLYLDRGRRADIAQLRQETQSGLAQMGERLDNGLNQTREEMQRGFAYLHKRIDKLTEAVLDLARRVGRLEGRAEATSAQTPQ
ncbi:MAG: hypothetical protein OXF00_05595 [bacterium]|nr:hypothetical protein [bacterium]